MDFSRRELGAAGESLAREFLSAQGLHIIDQNWRDGRTGELDIIAVDVDADCYVVVEVRTRIGERCGTPFASVDLRKFRQIRLLASSWLRRQAVKRHVRIDVVAVSVDSSVWRLPESERSLSECIEPFAQIRWERGVSL